MVKTLSIMQSTFNTNNKLMLSQDDSLMSPPLTPTDAQHPLSVMDHPMPVTTNHRKDFINSYSKMVRYLRPNSDCFENNKTIQLNVYKDYYLKQKKREQRKIRKAISNSLFNKNCTMLNNVVPHTKKRKLAIIPVKEDTMLSHEDHNQPIEQPKEEENVHYQKKRKRVSSFLPTGKDAAAAFDTIDIDTPDHEFYPMGWIPLKSALDIVPVKVSWKGAPMSIEQQPYFDQLHFVEVTMASVLRLTPIQYLRCKRTLILASRTLKIQEIPFTKSVAQKLCRVDVNKTSALWTAFGELGWFNGPV